MPQVTVEKKDRTLPCPPGKPLRGLMADAGWLPASICSGRGDCGLCQIRIIEGTVTPPTPVEMKRLSRSQLHKNLRLACQTIPLTDLKISLEKPVIDSGWQTLPREDCEDLLSTPRADSGNDPGYDPGLASGLAVDLGSSHIRLSVWDMKNRVRLAARTGINPQAAYGSDVLTRLTVASSDPGVAVELSGLVQKAIGEALRDMATDEAIRLAEIGTIIVVGNTPMLTLLAERNYKLLLNSGHWMKEIDCTPLNTDEWRRHWGVSEQTTISLMQPLGGFVGSDLLSGVLAIGAAEGSAPVLYIDFGTNSEIALWDGQTLWVTSAAGGPAFEGTGIRQGMNAGAGAIFRVEKNDDGSLSFAVIGNGEARGVCGSGLVDWIACLLDADVLTRGGRVREDLDGRRQLLNGPGGIALHPGDIDLIQRAKAAIAAGTRCLLKSAGVAASQLSKVCITGAFGRTLDVASACRIGLLPTVPRATVQLYRNLALAGCELLLYDSRREDAIASLKKKARLLNMAQTTEFEDLFLESLYLEPFPRESPGIES